MCRQLFCGSCDHLLFTDKEGLDFLARDYLPCPKCGGTNFRETDFTEERAIVFDGVSVKGRSAQGKAVLSMKTGGDLSADGTVAQVEQVIDRREKTYRKKVTLVNGAIVKDVYGPLCDQRLHGPQKKNSQSA